MSRENQELYSDLLSFKSFKCLDKDVKYSVKFMNLEFSGVKSVRKSFSIGVWWGIREKPIFAKKKFPKTRR